MERVGANGGRSGGVRPRAAAPHLAPPSLCAELQPSRDRIRSSAGAEQNPPGSGRALSPAQTRRFPLGRGGEFLATQKARTDRNGHREQAQGTAGIGTRRAGEKGGRGRRAARPSLGRPRARCHGAPGPIGGVSAGLCALSPGLRGKGQSSAAFSEPARTLSSSIADAPGARDVRDARVAAEEWRSAAGSGGERRGAGPRPGRSGAGGGAGRGRHRAVGPGRSWAAVHRGTI